MEKTVLILYGLPDAQVGVKYEEPYRILYGLAAERGIRMVRASIYWFHPERKVFEKYWAIENGSWAFHEEPITPDLVYDKAPSRKEFSEIKRNIARQYRMLNHPDFTEVADNKFVASELIPEHFKPYRNIASRTEFDAVQGELQGKLLVAKKAVGSGGADVFIGPSSEFDPETFSYPFILQEYIDSSAGIPGVTDGRHDLRLVFIDENLIYSYIRVPRADSHLANIAQGGSMFLVPDEKLPESLAAPIAAVQSIFGKFTPKVYTIDFMFDTDGRPWIIELNTKPGLYFDPQEREAMLNFYEKLLDVFDRMMEKDTPMPV